MRTILLSFFVLFCVIFGTDYAYQEWLSEQSEYEFIDVTSINQLSEHQFLSAPSGKTLVPSGAILGVNDVDVVIYTYLIDIEIGHTLDVAIGKVSLTKDTETYNDVDEVLSSSYEIEMLNETQAKVAISVYLNMPDTEEQYNLVMGSSASFQLVFKQNPIL
ncbi:hypothetical protein RJI07_02955 [Mycoplasmatota bacterium WC30]